MIQKVRDILEGMKSRKTTIKQVVEELRKVIQGGEEDPWERSDPWGGKGRKGEEKAEKGGGKWGGKSGRWKGTPAQSEKGKPENKGQGGKGEEKQEEGKEATKMGKLLKGQWRHGEVMEYEKVCEQVEEGTQPEGNVVM